MGTRQNYYRWWHTLNSKTSSWICPDVNKQAKVLQQLIFTFLSDLSMMDTPVTNKYSQMTLVELKKILRERKLKVTGKKKTLIDR